MAKVLAQFFSLWAHGLLLVLGSHHLSEREPQEEQQEVSKPSREPIVAWSCAMLIQLATNLALLECCHRGHVLAYSLCSVHLLLTTSYKKAINW
jgi:hypothetical protein